MLSAYREKIDELKAHGGYVTADVIDVTPETPGLDAMLARFNTEHWHDEDEVRLIVEGRGLFHIHPLDGPVFVIQVEPGDLIRVPRGTHHCSNLCGDAASGNPTVQDSSAWTPHYTLPRRSRVSTALLRGRRTSPEASPPPAPDVGALGGSLSG